MDFSLSLSAFPISLENISLATWLRPGQRRLTEVPFLFTQEDGYGWAPCLGKRKKKV